MARSSPSGWRVRESTEYHLGWGPAGLSYRDHTMIEFFRGWRRKVGCVTLVLACVFSAWWVRSYSRSDTLTWVRFTTLYAVQSTQGLIEWESRGSAIKDAESFQYFQRRWQSFPIPPDCYDEPLWNVKFFRTARRSVVFFSRDGEEPGDTSPRLLLVFPYWSIVVPLAAISALLLLSKPRPEVKPPITPASENA